MLPFWGPYWKVGIGLPFEPCLPLPLSTFSWRINLTQCWFSLFVCWACWHREIKTFVMFSFWNRYALRTLLPSCGLHFVLLRRSGVWHSQGSFCSFLLLYTSILCWMERKPGSKPVLLLPSFHVDECGADGFSGETDSAAYKTNKRKQKCPPRQIFAWLGHGHRFESVNCPFTISYYWKAKAEGIIWPSFKKPNKGENSTYLYSSKSGFLAY